MSRFTPEQLDQLLPQTQCGLCGFGGCMPYAEALIFEKAAINLCPPGGVDTLKALGSALNQDPNPFIDDMAQKAKSPSIVNIREAECIGCTKCIQACPVDAIVGSAKLMHTVISTACTGCDLCIPACPVDCIDVITTSQQEAASKEKAPIWRDRFLQREKRLAQEKKMKEVSKRTQTTSARQQYIEDALARAKAKKTG